MARVNRYCNIGLALLLAGSAILYGSCGKKKPAPADEASMITHMSDSLVIVESTNGLKKFRFKTPLMERYELAREPYMEFRKGIYVETFNDSTQVVESTLAGDYAIYFERQELWEVKGNVVAVNAKGEKLETQQLFWNQRTKKIYSNIDSKVTQGETVIVGEGFESDEEFRVWEFRQTTGQFFVDVEPTKPDTTKVAPVPAPQLDAPDAPDKP